MDEESEIRTVTWIFGRGASISCGLNWVEPPDAKKLKRNLRIDSIKSSLRNEQENIIIGQTPYSKLLTILEISTNQKWKHLFITTNWDTLLDKEIDRRIKEQKLEFLPYWLLDPSVFYINGSIKEPSNDQQSSFLLDDDEWGQIKSSYERNQGLQYTLLEKGLIVIIGLSLDYGIDKFLLKFIKTHEDKVALGDDDYVILNPNKNVVDNVCNMIKEVSPQSTVITVNKHFEDWIKGGLPELVQYGVINSIN